MNDCARGSLRGSCCFGAEWSQSGRCGGRSCEYGDPLRIMGVCTATSVVASGEFTFVWWT